MMSVQNSVRNKLEQATARLSALKEQQVAHLVSLESVEELEISARSEIEKLKQSAEIGKAAIDKERCLFDLFVEEQSKCQEALLDEYLAKHFTGMERVCHLHLSDQDTFSIEQKNEFRTSWSIFREGMEQSWKGLETEFIKELQSRQEKASHVVNRWELLQLNKKVDTLLERLKGDDFWRPAEITVTITELEILILRRNQQFLNWLHKIANATKETLDPENLNVKANEMEQQISAWNQENHEFLECFQKSLNLLNTATGDWYQVLSKAEEKLQDNSENLAIEEKVSEGRRIIQDRQKCFTKLRQSMKNSLTKQLLYFKTNCLKYIEFVKQLISLRLSYEEAIDEIKQELERGLIEIFSSIHESFTIAEGSLLDKIKEMESSEDASALNAYTVQLDAELEDSKTKLHVFQEPMKTMTTKISSTFNNKTSELLQKLKGILFIEDIEIENDVDLVKVIEAIQAIGCEVDIIEFNDSLSSEENEAEVSSDFMATEEGLECQRVYTIQPAHRFEDAFSQGVHFLKGIVIPQANKLIECKQRELDLIEDSSCKKLQSELTEKIAALEQLRLQEGTKVQEETLEFIAIAENTVKQHFLKIESALNDLKVEMKTSFDLANQMFDRFIESLEKHRTRLINARSLQALTNEEMKLQTADVQLFLENTLSPLKTKLDVQIRRIEEHLDQMNKSSLCDQESINKRLKIEHADHILKLREQVENIKFEIQESVSQFQKISEEQVTKLKCEILESIPVHKAEVEVLQALDKSVKDLKSELKITQEKRRQWFSQAVLKYHALHYMSSIGSSTANSTHNRTDCNLNSKQKQSVVEVCKEFIQQEVQELQKRAALEQQEIGFEIIEKLGYLIASLKTAFSITSLLSRVCCELFSEQTPEHFQRVQLDTIKFGPVELINESELTTADSIDLNSVEKSLHQKYTDQIHKVMKEFSYWQFCSPGCN
eukprot:g8209.t1